MPRRALLFSPVLLLLMVLLAPAAAAAPTTFADTADTGHEDAVASLVEQEIVQGCDTDSFCADDELTRGQAATMLTGALDLEPADETHFSDSDSSVHGTSIEALAAADLVAGCGDGRFCVSDPVTREQFATMLYRAFEIDDAPEDVTYFDDVNGPHRPAVRALAEAGIAAGCSERLTSFCAGDGVARAHAAMFLARTLDLVDRVELPPFEERAAEQQEIDERREAEELEAQQLQAAAQNPGQEAVDVALAQLGKPYRWGGSGPSSFDCSGLMAYAWAAAGVHLPHNSGMQFSATTRISRDELRPGDLVFYHSPISHVAMYIGDGRVVEAPNSGNNVRIREDGLTRSGVVGYGRP